VAVSGGWPQTDMGFDTSNYLYLEPGSYSVALAPTGKGIDQALLGPLDVKVDAGHRYTVVAMGQQGDPSHTPLLIDETAAFQEIGAAPTDSVQVTVNNLKGVPAFDWFLAGKPVVSNVSYGGFKAAIWPVGYRDDVVKVSGETDKVLHNEGNIQFYGPGRDEFACWGGSYPGRIPSNYDNVGSEATSELNAIDFLQGFTDASAKNGGKTPTFVTLLAAIKQAGLTDTLLNDSPYVLFAPTDAAFAALPKDKLAALMADPKGLADLLRNHIVEGHHPRGTLDKRPLMNMLGATFTLHGGEYISINGEDVAPGGDFCMLANGSRVYWITKVLLPEPTGTAADSPTATASDVPTSTAVMTFAGHTEKVVQASFSPDGKTVLTGSEDQTARLWDAATGKELRQFIGHTHELRGAIFSPDGKTIFTTSNDQTARLWDVATDKELRQFIGHTDQVNKAAFSHDGKLVVTTSPDGTARVWDVSTAKSLLTFTGHAPSSPNRPAFAPDGQAIVTGGLDGTVLMWEPLTGTILKTFKGHTGSVGTPAFSPDGKYLVTPSDDGTARLWDVASLKELRRFEIPGVVIAGAAFSPDGKYLATSGFDGIARLWDAQTGKELRQFVGHTDEVRTVVFSPDGKYILTASHDGTARLWRVE
jgi:WD40 repeat protein